jgi:hypothetical protein
MKWVDIYCDDEAFKIGFVFSAQKPDDHFFPVYRKEGTNCFRCSLAKAFRQRSPWIAYIADQHDVDFRRFVARNEGEHWIIDFGMPPFGSMIERRAFKVQKGTVGVYQYFDGGEIVYIGRGDIRRRFQEDQRHHWQFTHVNYAVVTEKKKQEDCEHLLLARFEQQRGRLPRYNRNGGKKLR